ncbi:hypothetical protein PS467_22020 [Streptomyces luomodiensis]|uniref:DUF7660 domain-containing protein n=1 Tax=Streptomyces luomodiensis TaxID=3026192 RepID=A0ABY9V2C0_9ACTN|nr:hypothetical protein [Streptomyces sp. SCA4-21]WNE97818.1 hypothetical protein PS467_22020 [Streptomyces sp. SCA4-21]
MEDFSDHPAHGVDSREALVSHILGLRDDLLERGDECENPTLEHYLEALAAWPEGSPAWYRHFGEEMPADDAWTLFARALSAAVVYE